MSALARNRGFITMHGLVSVVLGLLLGAVAGLSLLVGLTLLFAGKRGSSFRQVGLGLTAGSLLPAAVAVALATIPDSIVDSGERMDGVALVAAPAAALVGLLIVALVARRSPPS